MKTKIFALCAIYILALSCQDPGKYFQGAICLENISTIDASSGLAPNMTVVIKEGRILMVEKTKDLKLSSQNKVIDGTGKYLIPGLWDAHVHFAFIEELAPSMFDLFLIYGITSVRDTGGKIGFVKKWKDAALADPTNAPRVMIAGPLIDGMPNVYDGSSPGRPPLSVGLSTVADVEAYIDKLDSLGVDLIKAYEMLTPEQFVAVSKRAREKGLKVTGHVPLSMDVISASNAGLNSMEHMRNLDLSVASNADELLERRQRLLAEGKLDQGGVLRSRIHSMQRKEAVENSDETQIQKVLSVLAKNQTWQIPTLTLSTTSVEKPFDQSGWKESFKYLPPEIEAIWVEGAAGIMEGEPSEWQVKYRDWLFDMVGKIHDANIGIMAGTDCPITYLTPGLSLHAELASLVKAGLSPLDAIESATLRPAQYFEMEDELGLIREGMFADLLILDANPLDDIANTKKINSVIKEGKLFSRADLDEMMKKLDQN